MILCDTGPLVAIIDPGQGEIHAHCVAALDNLRDTFVTTWPCITEAMYLVHGIGGLPLQRILWRLLATDVFEIHSLVKADGARADELMERYRNVPMDFADASLCVASEKIGTRRILTLDNDFRIYRFEDGGIFDVI